jgi:hypothetical protein
MLFSEEDSIDASPTKKRSLVSSERFFLVLLNKLPHGPNTLGLQNRLPWDDSGLGGAAALSSLSNSYGSTAKDALRLIPIRAHAIGQGFRKGFLGRPLRELRLCPRKRCL